MNTLTPFHPLAQRVAQRVQGVFETRPGLTPDMAQAYVLTRDASAVWLLILLDEVRVKPETLKDKKTLHHFSTINNGRPALLSNSNGLRLALLLTDPPALPVEVAFPGMDNAVYRVGVNSRGQEIAIPWRELTHGMFAGATQNGKSNAVRGLLHQALEAGHQVVLVDTQNITAPHLAGHPGLELCTTLADAPAAIEGVYREFLRREQLFKSTPGYFENVDQFNARTGQNLPYLFLAVEEFCGLVNIFGKSSPAYNHLLQLVWQSLKFGIRVVGIGQTWEKDLVGAVGDQMSTRVCFRMEKREQAQIILQRSGAERIAVKGRADTSRWGMVQFYRFPLPNLTPGPSPESGEGSLSDADREQLSRLAQEGEGRATFAVLEQLFGWGRREAEKRRAAWAEAGIVAPDPNEKNAWKLTPEYMAA
ncbi:MAG TPA: FtsK/SpoIIIE domain-containing protein [Anaerolineales bacterium]|nr:FtsK/SpoIIIE domain-containing protein [Anaerolineales bacterium]